MQRQYKHNTDRYRGIQLYRQKYQTAKMLMLVDRGCSATVSIKGRILRA